MARSKRKGHLEPIGKLLNHAYPSKRRYDAVRVFHAWSQCVSPRVLKNARPVFLKDGVLTVNVTTSVWVQELHYMHADLLRQLHRVVHKGMVHQINFKVGPLPDLPVRSKKKRATKSAPVSLSELGEPLARALGRIDDDGLRNLIARAATRRPPD